MDFTFGVCTYNSEEFIIEGLESIRYQMVNYGKNYSVTLIVSDDCSSDNTILWVNRWLEKYGDIFAKTLVLTSDKNVGIAGNYARLLRNIKTEYFKELDGDDVLSSFNVFEQVTKPNGKNMNIYAPIHMRDGVTFMNDFDVSRIYYYSNIKHTHKRDLQNFVRYKPFMTPEICLKREFYTEGCLQFVEQYTQFEDNTSLYYILKNNSDMLMNYILEPMILHRLHGAALSSGGMSLHQIQFLDDLHKLNRYMLRSEKNVISRFVIFASCINTFLMKHRFATKHSLHSKIQKRRNNSIRKKVITDAGYAEHKIKMEHIVKNEQAHLKYIHDSALEFMK